MELLLIRHGQSLANIGECDHCDCDLSDLGVQQALALGRHLRAEFDLADFKGLVSPYLRARRTAMHISEGTGLAFAVHPGCREWGKDCTVCDEHHPEETLENAIQRVAGFLDSLDAAGKYVVVSHATPVFIMLQLAIGNDASATRLKCEGEFWEVIVNCAVTHIKGGELLCLSKAVV